MAAHATRTLNTATRWSATAKTHPRLAAATEVPSAGHMGHPMQHSGSRKVTYARNSTAIKAKAAPTRANLDCADSAFAGAGVRRRSGEWRATSEAWASFSPSDALLSSPSSSSSSLLTTACAGEFDARRLRRGCGWKSSSRAGSGVTDGRWLVGDLYAGVPSDAAEERPDAVDARRGAGGGAGVRGALRRRRPATGTGSTSSSSDDDDSLLLTSAATASTGVIGVAGEPLELALLTHDLGAEARAGVEARRVERPERTEGPRDERRAVTRRRLPALAAALEADLASCSMPLLSSSVSTLLRERWEEVQSGCQG